MRRPFDELERADAQRLYHLSKALRSKTGQYLSRVITPKRRSHCVALRFRLSARAQSQRRRAALHDGALEEPHAARRHELQADAVAAGRRPGNRDSIGIATKGRNVVA